MTDEEFSAFREGRFVRLLGYYDSRANRNRRWHYFCSVYILVISIAILPLMTLDVPAKDCLKIIGAILAPTVALMIGIENIFQFYDNWLRYRATWDALQHELAWRDASVREYSDSSRRNSLFVERVEELITREGRDWIMAQEMAARIHR
jgi:Protein of unknown function (DUF4231)